MIGRQTDRQRQTHGDNPKKTQSTHVKMIKLCNGHTLHRRLHLLNLSQSQWLNLHDSRRKIQFQNAAVFAQCFVQLFNANVAVNFNANLKSVGVMSVNEDSEGEKKKKTKV